MKELTTNHVKFLRRREKIESKIIQPVERLAFSWRRANFCNLTGERQRNHVDIGRFVGLVVEKEENSQPSMFSL